MTNPLVAQEPESNDGFITKGSGDAGWATGIGIAESVNDVSSLNEGSNWVASGLAYGGLAMEGISLAVDPIGTLLSYGLSWLIEHVQPLKEALDWFAGDPDGVEAYGKTWENVSKAVSEAAEQYNAAVKADTADWTGAAGDAYRTTAAEKAEALTGAAQLAGTISSVVTIMGEVVAFVREFVRDLVADCVSRLITYALEAVLPPIASLAWVIPQAVAFISKTVTKIVDIVTKLTKTISNVSPKLAKLAEVFGDIMKTLGNMGKATAGGLGKVADKIDVAEHLAKKTWQKVDDTFGTDVVGRRNARMGGPDAPDGVDSATDSESGGGSGGPSSASESGGSGSSGTSSPGDAQSSVRSEPVGDSGGSRSEPGSGGSSPGGRTEAESGTSGGRTDAGSGSQSHADAGQGSGGSSRTDADSGSGSGGSANSDAGSQARTDSSADPGSGTQARTDSSPESGSGARPDASPDSGGQARSESSTSGGSQADSGSAGQSQSSDAGSGGASTHTSDVPREPAHTSAAGVDAPARQPETAAPQSAPSAPRQDQPSGAAPTGGANAPGSPSAPGGGTPAPRGGRQGGWTGSSGHPGAARDLPSRVGVGEVSMKTSPTPTREAPHTPAPPGTPVQRQQVAPPRPEQLRTADSPRTPIPAQRVPEAPNSLPEQPQPDAPKISTSDSMAAETPPKDQWQAGHHMVDHTPRLDLSPDLRNKLGTSVRDIEATGAGLSFTKPPVKDYYGRADWAHKRPRCSVDPNRFTVEMHGSPNGVKFKGNHLDAKELAEIIRGSAGYKNGTPVRLVSCETGADVPDGSKNFAQQLSEELGVEVLAPNTNAWVDNYGNIYANESSAKFDKNEPGTPKPRLDSPGEWTAFRPDGTKAVHSSPYPPGHQPEWVRHGIQAEGARMRGIFGRRKDEDFSTDPVTGHNFSNAPPPGQYGPPQGQHAPPQGPYGPPQPQFSPQGHFPQQGHLPRGQHPGQVQGSPQQGQRFSPQGQGSPQQGYLQQGAQGYGLQSHPPANPAQQPRPQPNAAQQHYSNTPHHGKQHPSASHGYPQHSPRQGQPQHHSQQGGHPVHAQRPPQAPQQGVHLPPQPHQGGYAPPPQQAAPPRPPQQQQGHPLHGGQPNAFSPSGRTPPQNVAQNAPAPASGGYTPQRQPAQGHAPKAAAPAPSPAAPAASGQPHTPWNSTTPQSPSGPAHQSPPAQASSPAPKAQGPEPTSAPKRPVGGNPTSQPAQAGHGPSAAPAQQTDVPRSAGHQPHDAGSAAPHAPTTASKPALGDFAPTQSGTLSGADAPADASWKSDFDPAGESKTSDGSADPESATTSKPVLEDVDRGPAHSEASHTSSHVEESVAPKAQTDAMTQASPATTNADKTFADVEPSKPDHGLDAASSSGSAHEPSGPDEFGSGTHKQHGDDQPDAVSEDHGPKGVAALDGETTIGAQSPERVDRDELLQQIADPSFRADHETLKSVESYYENHPLGLDLEQTLQLQIDRYLSDLRSRDPEFAARIDQMSHTERLQVHAYTRTFYEELNSALRSGDPEALGRQRERIEVLSAALNQIPDVSCKAHRTVTTNNPVFAQAIADGYEPGSVITEPAYTSTSVREDPANPGEPKSKFGGLVEFHMDLKTGKDVRLFNPNGGEAEILVPAGAAFKVVDKWHDGKVWHIKLEQVHPDDLPSGGLPPAPNVDYTPPNPEPMGGTGSDIGKLLSGDFG